MSARQLSHPVVLTSTTEQLFYLVRSGDTLSAIARRTCGHAGKWPNLWWANRKLVSNPNAINVGWKLALPACQPVSSHVLARALAAVPKPPAPKPVVVVSAPQSAPVPADPAAPAPAPAGGNVSTAGMGAFQACVIQAESGGDPTAVNPSSGAGGLYGFLPSTWAGLGFSGLPEDASVAEQNAAFAKEYAQSGTSAWAAYDGC